MQITVSKIKIDRRVLTPEGQYFNAYYHIWLWYFWTFT